jgi:hypothetical protein
MSIPAEKLSNLLYVLKANPTLRLTILRVPDICDFLIEYIYNISLGNFALSLEEKNSFESYKITQKVLLLKTHSSKYKIFSSQKEDFYVLLSQILEKHV